VKIGKDFLFSTVYASVLQLCYLYYHYVMNKRCS